MDRGISAFNTLSFFEFKENWYTQIKQEVITKQKEYILQVEEDKFANYLFEKYSLTPLAIDFNSESVLQPTKKKEIVHDRHNRSYEVEDYHFIISYNYSGSGVLFNVRPNPSAMTSNEIFVDENKGTVSFKFKMERQDVNEFNQRKDEISRRAFTNLEALNKNIVEITDGLMNAIKSYISSEKQKYQKENDFFAEINVKVDPATTSVFTPPVIKKKVIPQPQVPSGTKFKSEPTMSKEMYNDILKVTYDAGKGMERKPSLYRDKDEEGLREQFLFILETRYESTTATGETFNRSGKTDIVLKYSGDGSNLFVAECKVWHGASEFQKAITQLLSYLTWRDSKAAVILFVKNKDFTNVLNVIKEEALKHSCALKIGGESRESSFSFEYHLLQDKNKSVFIEIMAFHFDN